MVPIELHWSDLNTLMMCGERLSLQKQFGQYPPRSVMIVGSGTHDVIELDLTSKMESGVLLPESDIKDAAGDLVVARVDREGLGLTKDELYLGRKRLVGQMKDETISLAVLHHRQAAPHIEPVSIEKKWRLNIEGTDYSLAGRIDIEEAFGIRDTKTTKMAPTQKRADSADQLTMYGLAKTVMDGCKIEDLSFCFDFLHKLKTPQYKPISTERTQKDIDALLRKIGIAFKVIESGLFMPTSRENWWCSPEWCAYYEICEYTG